MKSMKNLLLVMTFIFSFAHCIASQNGNHVCRENFNQTEVTNQDKIRFDNADLEITDDKIFLHVENQKIEINAVRLDEKGFFLFEEDILAYNLIREKTWKCPYCFYYWPIGQKCQNKNCPTNRW